MLSNSLLKSSLDNNLHSQRQICLAGKLDDDHVILPKYG